MSGNKRTVSYYFDACVYLAYLRNEEKTYGKTKIKAIESLWEQSERGGVTIVTSSLTITEVMANQLTEKSRKRFKQALDSGIHHFEDPSPPISVKASDYRIFYQHHPIQNPFGEGTRSDLTTVDAIHLATAVNLNVDYFFTFDGLSKKKVIGLLWLKNKVAADNLVICEPVLDQTEFSNF